VANIVKRQIILKKLPENTLDFFSVMDEGEADMVKIQLYVDGKESAWVRMRKERLLQVFVDLWPDEVAFQIKKDEDYDCADYD